MTASDSSGLCPILVRMRRVAHLQRLHVVRLSEALLLVALLSEALLLVALLLVALLLVARLLLEFLNQCLRMTMSLRVRKSRIAPMGRYLEVSPHFVATFPKCCMNLDSRYPDRGSAY